MSLHLKPLPAGGVYDPGFGGIAGHESTGSENDGRR